MNCTQARSEFSSFLDGRVGRQEHAGLAEHLVRCTACGAEYRGWVEAQSMVASLGRKPAPADLAVRIKVAISQERKSNMGWRMQSLAVRLENLVNTFMLPATGGVVTAILMFGLLIGFFSSTRVVAAGNDVPTSLYTPPRLAANPFVTNVSTSGPVVIEAFVDANGRLEDYRIISGSDSPEVRKQLDRALIFTIFEPAMSFGAPASGKVVISFSNVNVQG